LHGLANATLQRRSASNREVARVAETLEGSELGTSTADTGEDVLGRAHERLQAVQSGTLDAILASGSVADFLGALWIKRHPQVLPAIQELQRLLAQRQDG